MVARTTGRALASNYPLHDLGGLEPRIHFGGDPVSRPRRSSAPMKERRSGKGGRSRCVRRRGGVAELRRGAADCRVATRSDSGSAGLLTSRPADLAWRRFAWRRFPMPAAVERDEPPVPETGYWAAPVSASGLGVILEGEQDVSPFPRREAPECSCPSPERASAR